MSTTLTIPEPAWKTHEDGEDDAVRQRLEGCVELGETLLDLRELKASCKRAAAQGVDPIANGIVELGLLLPEDEYELLKGYAKSLKIEHRKTRRHS